MLPSNEGEQEMSTRRRRKQAHECSKSKTPVIVVVVTERRRFLVTLGTAIVSILSGMVPELVKQFWARPEPRIVESTGTVRARSTVTGIGSVVLTPAAAEMSMVGEAVNVEVSPA
jgi:hypothetical protein